MDKTIQMAREAGIHTAKLLRAYGNNKKALCHSEIEELRQIERFAELVRADERDKWMERAHTMILGEREACAKVCDDIAKLPNDLMSDAPHIAAAIRARGNT